MARLQSMEHLEGRQSVLAALQAGHRRLQLILIRQGVHAERMRDIVEMAAQRGVPIRYAERCELDAMAHGSTHGGVIAVCTAKPRMTPEDMLDMVARLREAALLLLLEGVDDARNLGFTLRSAEAFGAHAVLIKKHLWDFDAVEVARPASGAYERMPLVQVENLDIVRQLQKRDVLLLGCIAGAKRTIYETDLKAPAVVAIGGERRGLSGRLRAICDAFMTIPTRRGASSLSLSHAAAIVMAEAVRQRRGTSR